MVRERNQIHLEGLFFFFFLTESRGGTALRFCWGTGSFAKWRNPPGGGTDSPNPCLSRNQAETPCLQGARASRAASPQSFSSPAAGQGNASESLRMPDLVPRPDANLHFWDFADGKRSSWPFPSLSWIFLAVWCPKASSPVCFALKLQASPLLLGGPKRHRFPVCFGFCPTACSPVSRAKLKSLQPCQGQLSC